ncbi:2-amino-4-hydroxy-6-hydroxymethyldihydropteridine diphosphokinase [Clostridium perfringens]|uniref:2-amino-4-hydroxy-6- hydroxymethyldihydropteridine diphosphokinase n=1 Tax=Clostridium perfringens TaxID=1502 RepID=UPI001128C0DC|nr:2-amino-4-hydroxy-6-hydroxymethyldihydropteridine diphosphokinase [Clostridium perfringens]EHK2400276.1 2-amino-4-hydroxy-6-hydroxymethyldihydropteridine diphosphokinase [Clostridium perfringens]MDK0784193.1 2-amino-4-hydroxy-6-hydroxymethyldihydropteridine diphosphokinase [Clostridium perfringens]MDK0844813.1 2-amino-4-hydroxy-6-hydroxymethyldihydropteridine diphosphokinase [Clostridium perfringens]MDM0741888.1 2-amino-4-hydroxy-6-hydroxymethyldihydropteridine diphosphokinase [Clostridium p
MDKIIIKDFEVFGNHGVFEEEKRLGQKFVLSIELFLDTREAGVTGDLSKSVHYGELAHKVEEEFKKQSYDLIETAAEKLCEFILLEYNLVKKVKVSLKKPWAPILRSLDTVSIEIERGWNEAYLSYGSNIGDKKYYIEEALNEINKAYHTEIIKKSNLIETEPWGYTEQDEFLNGACKIKTLLNPKELIRFLLDIEQKLKRERKIKWGPRTIDLDVIFFNDLISEDEEIILPHPRMHERSFVLEPLNEIAPYKVHPLYRKRVFELLEELNKNKYK